MRTTSIPILARILPAGKAPEYVAVGMHAIWKASRSKWKFLDDSKICWLMKMRLQPNHYNNNYFIIAEKKASLLSPPRRPSPPPHTRMNTTMKRIWKKEQRRRLRKVYASAEPRGRNRGIFVNYIVNNNYNNISSSLKVDSAAFWRRRKPIRRKSFGDGSGNRQYVFI